MKIEQYDKLEAIARELEKLRQEVTDEDEGLCIDCALAELGDILHD